MEKSIRTDKFEKRVALLERGFNKMILYLYLMKMPGRIKRIRAKEKIKVLFILTELNSWKTENLFLKMLDHERFEPVLGLSASTEDPGFFEPLKHYVTERQYPYSDLREYSLTSISPDIIFYEKPYLSVYPDYVRFTKHLNSLFCYVYYAFNSMDADWAVELPLFRHCWQIYMENETVVESRRSKMWNKGRNLVVTGLPIMDGLLEQPQSDKDPWPVSAGKYRIIYAPHHTIGNLHMEGIAFSTFLDLGEDMLTLAEKYSDRIQWAFRPHPILKSKLYQIWGQDRTDSYYARWQKLDANFCLEGPYIELFKHSDAMIHDCASFTIEYHYTHNPVLYLVRGDDHCAAMNSFGAKAFNLHYKAHDIKEIEAFIEKVISGEDERRAERDEFFRTSLLPPGGRSACDNIISAILGK